jgi:hypothetical protein
MAKPKPFNTYCQLLKQEPDSFFLCYILSLSPFPLSLSLSFSLCLSPFLNISLSLSLRDYISLSLLLSLRDSFSLSLIFFISLSFFLSLSDTHEHELGIKEMVFKVWGINLEKSGNYETFISLPTAAETAATEMTQRKPISH